MDLTFATRNAGWIISVFSLLGVIASVLIAYGGLKRRIEEASELTRRFHSELYQPNGVTVFMPRSEAHEDKKEILAAFKAMRDDFRTDCGMRRGECQTQFLHKVDVLRADLKGSYRLMETFQSQQQANSRGIVSISSQLSLLLRAKDIGFDQTFSNPNHAPEDIGFDQTFSNPNHAPDRGGQ